MSAVPADFLPRVACGAGNVGVPLARPRSRAYSARRAKVSLPLSADALPVMGAAPADRLPGLIAAVAAVLYRYSGESVLCVGTAPPAASDANALPVLLEVGPGTTLGSLQLQADGALREAQRLAATPFQILIEQLGLADVTNRNPLFSVAVRDTETQAPLTDTRCDVHVSLSPGPRFALEADYSSRLLGQASVVRFLNHVVRMLAVASRQDLLVRDAEYLLPQERQEMLTVGAGRVGPASAQCTVLSLFSEQVRRTPQAPALYADGKLWSYAELDEQTNVLAARLQERGAQPRDLIGLCVLIGPRQLLWMLAILKCGATVVPFDWTFPAHRIAQLFKSSGVSDLVTERGQLELFPSGTRALVLETEAQMPRPREVFRPAKVSGEDPIYLLYTSGSTGRPKGVVMPHRAIANLAIWQHGQSGDAGARTLQRTSISFDVSWQEIFSTWCFGGQLIIATDAQRADISSWPEILQRHAITRVFLPVVALHQLAELIREPLPALAELIVAGEQLRVTPAVMRMFQLLRARLVNQYGPTETHVVTQHVMTGPSLDWPTLPPIGTPVDNAHVLVLDEFAQPAPAGVDGEIYIGGAPLARGYHSDDEMTHARFVPGVAAELRNERLYRTGDFGHFTESGILEFVGRRDSQIKLRGYRIELGELEGTLSAMPGVRQAAAMVWADERGEKRLAVHVVPSQEGRLSPAIIRAYLRERLPDYMVPSLGGVVLSSSLPMTSSGKIDRQKLSPPPAVDLEPADPSRANTIEQTVRAIWARHLRVSHIAPGDAFLDLGGHSLLAIHIVSEINEHFATSLALAELLRGPTLAAFTRLVENAVRGSGTGDGAQVSAVPDTATEVVLPNGTRVFAPYAPEAHYLYSDVFEHRTYDQHGVRYEPGACIVDLGANIGIFTLYAAERAPGCRVIAVEPALPLWTQLRRNVARLGDQVTPVNCAISNRDGTAELTYYPAIPGMSSLHADADHERTLLTKILENLAADGRPEIRELIAHQSDFIGTRLSFEKFPCRVRTFSTLRQELALDSIDLLKVDVQKAELEVLLGIADTDWQRIRQIVVEVHDVRGQLQRITDLLTSRGYALNVGEQTALHRGSCIHFVYATRQRN
jgi:amino acid adenylation domain-containing protein/FkbM family methyltransferase